MKPATYEDKERVVDILTTSFHANPHVNWVIKQEEATREQRRRAVMNFGFESEFYHNNIYLTDDRNGAAIWSRPRKNRKGLRYLWLELQMAWQALGMGDIWRNLKVSTYIDRQHPQTDFMYLWMIGVYEGHQGKGLSSELMNPMLKACEKTDLPVYLETDVKANVALYEHKGFETYQEYYLNGDGPLIWLMRKG